MPAIIDIYDTNKCQNANNSSVELSMKKFYNLRDCLLRLESYKLGL